MDNFETHTLTQGTTATHTPARCSEMKCNPFLAQALCSDKERRGVHAGGGIAENYSSNSPLPLLLFGDSDGRREAGERDAMNCTQGDAHSHHS